MEGVLLLCCGRAGEVEAALAAAGAGEAVAVATVSGVSSSSLSGLAIRKPPSDCDRLRSPFMALGKIQGSKNE